MNIGFFILEILTEHESGVTNAKKVRTEILKELDFENSTNCSLRVYKLNKTTNDFLIQRRRSVVEDSKVVYLGHCILCLFRKFRKTLSNVYFHYYQIKKESFYFFVS